MSTNQFLRPFGSKRPEVERVQYINILIRPIYKLLIRLIRFIRLNSLFKTLSLNHNLVAVHDVDALLRWSSNLAAVQIVPY